MLTYSDEAGDRCLVLTCGLLGDNGSLAPLISLQAEAGSAYPTLVLAVDSKGQIALFAVAHQCLDPTNAPSSDISC
jgi:hypothetical protein